MTSQAVTPKFLPAHSVDMDASIVSLFIARENFQKRYGISPDTVALSHNDQVYVYELAEGCWKRRWYPMFVFDHLLPNGAWYVAVSKPDEQYTPLGSPGA